MAACGRSAVWRIVVRASAGVLALPLSACLLVISTSPTSHYDAQIVVVVRSVDGPAVAGAAVGLHAADSGAVLGGGVTDAGGRFSMAVSRDVSRLRIAVDAPAGYRSPASATGVTLPPPADAITIRLEADR